MIFPKGGKTLDTLLPVWNSTPLNVLTLLVGLIRVALTPLFQFNPKGKLVLDMTKLPIMIPEEDGKSLRGLTIGMGPMSYCKPNIGYWDVIISLPTLVCERVEIGGTVGILHNKNDVKKGAMGGTPALLEINIGGLMETPP